MSTHPTGPSHYSLSVQETSAEKRPEAVEQCTGPMPLTLLQGQLCA